MEMINKLKKAGVLGDLRMRYGAFSKLDDSFDDEINALTTDEVMEMYCAWNLGDSSWWLVFKELHDTLTKNEPKKCPVPGLGKDRQIPPPDCHFYDEESGKWMWAYSKELIDSIR